jgi:hypothetical protein
MTQLDDLQAYVNLELPRRTVLLTVTITGYDGDPNDGGAPAIINNAPVGTYYLQETPETMWRKNASGIWIESEALPSPVVTATDITVTIDPTSTVPTPPSGVIFNNQASVDAYLTANGGVSFKYIQDYLDTLPPFIMHSITVNLVAGVHRPPSPGGQVLLLSRRRVDPGELIFQGTSLASWITVHAGGTIRAHQTYKEVTGTEDPYIDCDPGTFPNDGSLNGRFAVFSNGYYSQIWDHTDSRLWLTLTLAPVPIDDTTTVAVKQPSTILRNSVDDTTRSHYYAVQLNLGESTWSDIGTTQINDVILQDFSANIGFYISNSRYDFNRVIDDKIYGPVAEDQTGFYIDQGSLVYLNYCSFISTVPPIGADAAFSVWDSTIYPWGCYFQGGDDFSMRVSGLTAQAWVVATVIRGAGGAVRAAVAAEEGAVVDLINFTLWQAGVIPTIIDAKAAGAISVDGGGVNEWFNHGGVRLRGTVGPGVTLLGNAILDLTAVEKALDDGGNLDVGFYVSGPRASLTLSTLVALSGALGDVRMSDGSIWSYSQITSLGPLLDEKLNIVER